MFNFEHIGLFGTNRHFLVVAKEWWLKNVDRFKGWNVFLNPANDSLQFINYEGPYRNFYVLLLKDDYSSIRGKRFDIIVNPPEYLKNDCYYILKSGMHSFVTYSYVFDILEFILERNNELDCLDYQSLKNKDAVYGNNKINSINGISFSKDSIPSYISFDSDPAVNFVTIDGHLDGSLKYESKEFIVKDSSLGMKSDKVIFDDFIYDDYQKLIKDLLNLEFGKGGIKMDIRNKIEDVIFNGPATIVKWTDGTKTVVKCNEGEINNPYMGLAMCISKKVLGNKGNFNEVFKKWITPDVINPYMTAPQEGK